MIKALTTSIVLHDAISSRELNTSVIYHKSPSTPLLFVICLAKLFFFSLILFGSGGVDVLNWLKKILNSPESIVRVPIFPDWKKITLGTRLLYGRISFTQKQTYSMFAIHSNVISYTIIPMYEDNYKHVSKPKGRKCVSKSSGIAGVIWPVNSDRWSGHFLKRFIRERSTQAMVWFKKSILTINPLSSR